MKSKREYLAGKRRAAGDAYLLARRQHAHSAALGQRLAKATTELLRAELREAKPSPQTPKTRVQSDSSPDLFNL
jgi:hypothetical protein